MHDKRRCGRDTRLIETSDAIQCTANNGREKARPSLHIVNGGTGRHTGNRAERDVERRMPAERQNLLDTARRLAHPFSAGS